MKFFSAACIFTFLVTSCAKSTFTYSEGMCNYIGSYNPKKVSEVQLQNTLNKLIFPASIETNWTAWELGDIEELSLVALEAECSTRMNELEVLSFPDEESITLLKESRIREFQEACETKMLTIIGYKNPDTLLSFPTSDEMINFYREGLVAGGDSLISVWKELVRIQKLNNAYPERIQAEFDEQYSSPLRLEYARLTVMMFGWWNSVNHVIYHTPEELYYGQFGKFFSKIEEDCDF